jgi:hypothetical protein
MKPKDAGVRRTSNRRSAPGRIPRIPMEWMDPMSWRLPSGKELAEFALQAGFLAPLMLGGPKLKRPKPAAPVPVTPRIEPKVLEQREVPEHSGTFRQTR